MNIRVVCSACAYCNRNVTERQRPRNKASVFLLREKAYNSL